MAGAITLSDVTYSYSKDASASFIVIQSQTLSFKPGAAITLTPSAGFPLHTISVSAAADGKPSVVADGRPQNDLDIVTDSSSTASTKPTAQSNSANSSQSASRSVDAGKTTTSENSSGSATSPGMPNSSNTATAENQSSTNGTSSPTSRASSSSNGLSKGAAAGVGVGCAIVGALIAACLVFLLMRRKRRGRASSSYALQEKPATLSKQANGSVKPVTPASGAFALAEASLPLPLEDAAIGGEISRLQTLIKNYAQSYYHTSPVTSKSPDLSALGPHLSIPTATLAAMLGNPRTRVVAIRYCVAWTIFSRIGLDTDASMSLLPPEVAGCTRPMAADVPSKNSNPSLAPWRALTHSLLSPTYPTSASTPLNAASLQSAVSALDTILQPYADTNRDSYERMTKLEEIIKRGAKFGWTLFSQVSCFDFFWERRTSGEVGIFPALLQTVDEKGEKLGGRGRIMWEGEGTRVEGM